MKETKKEGRKERKKEGRKKKRRMEGQKEMRQVDIERSRGRKPRKEGT